MDDQDRVAQLDAEAGIMAAWVVHRDEAIVAALDVMEAGSSRTPEMRLRLACSILHNALQARPREVNLV
jgi:hypothetical protein